MACVGFNPRIVSQYQTRLTRADLVIVVIAVVIGHISKVVVVRQGDAAVITLVVAADKSKHAFVLAD